MFTHNATLFSTGLSNSYRCLKQQNYTLNSTNAVGYLMISDLQFQAFKTDKTTDFGEGKYSSSILFFLFRNKFK